MRGEGEPGSTGRPPGLATPEGVRPAAAGGRGGQPRARGPVTAPHRCLTLGRAHEVRGVAAEPAAGLRLTDFDFARHLAGGSSSGRPPAKMPERVAQFFSFPLRRKKYECFRSEFKVDIFPCSQIFDDKTECATLVFFAAGRSGSAALLSTTANSRMPRDFSDLSAPQLRGAAVRSSGSADWPTSSRHPWKGSPRAARMSTSARPPASRTRTRSACRGAAGAGGRADRDPARRFPAPAGAPSSPAPRCLRSSTQGVS